MRPAGAAAHPTTLETPHPSRRAAPQQARQRKSGASASRDPHPAPKPRFHAETAVENLGLGTGCRSRHDDGCGRGCSAPPRPSRRRIHPDAPPHNRRVTAEPARRPSQDPRHTPKPGFRAETAVENLGLDAGCRSRRDGGCRARTLNAPRPSKRRIHPHTPPHNRRVGAEAARRPDGGPLRASRRRAPRSGLGCRHGSHARRRCPGWPGRRASSPRSACRGRTGRHRRTP